MNKINTRLFSFGLFTFLIISCERNEERATHKEFEKIMHQLATVN